jgi:hypothetical protein
MTFEQRSAGPPPEPAPTPVVGSVAPGSAPSPVQIRLQILSTEHWSLLASRGLAWNEAFSRAGMYLSTLSASIVTLGLIGGIDGFGTAFFAFAFVILPVDLFVGIGAWTRIAASNYHDAQTILGMNRIRAAYLEIAPDLKPYFLMGVHDDMAGAQITMAVPPGTPQLAHLIASTPFLVVILNAVVAGAIGALALVRAAGADLGAALVGGLVTAALALIAEMLFARRNIRILQGSIHPMFPTPPMSDGTDRTRG